MSSKTINVKILLRNDLASNWTNENPVLGKGEMGVEIDTKKFKFGDGITPWNQLPYGTSSNYIAGNGIVIEDNQIAIDNDLLIDCGTSTTVI